jgi:N-acetylglucosaminyldiphosphoundecaprenol N-acetyl-beta-D-mannosaminyltransferase
VNPAVRPAFHRLIGVRVDSSTVSDATARILSWACEGRSRYICFGTVSALIECTDSTAYRNVLEQADLVTSDGMPLVWLLRALGAPGAGRVYGPDLVPLVLDGAARAGLPVGFYGGTETALARLTSFASERFPGLQIAYAASPPFRPATPAEDANTVSQIQEARVRILFVGLGSPKQDFWMHAHAGRIDAVMLGVGAAFDFLAGTKPQAPRWMQRSGLEWLFRLSTEPKRLWRRYLQNNPRFIVLVLAQLLRTRLNEHCRTP